MKKMLLTLAALAMTLSGMANPIGKQAALTVAKNFMQEVNPAAVLQTTTVRHAPGQNSSGDTQPYYVFNAENNQGFVIVSGDDRSEEILGYSDEGTFDVENMPEALKAMLTGFVDDLKKLDEAGLTEPLASARQRAPRKSVAIGRKSVAPMTKSLWTQGIPYNSKTTLYESGNRAPVGCMATAVGQLIYFWQYANIQYTIPGYGSFSSLPPREFDFSKLRDSYPYSQDIYGNISYSYSKEEWELIGEFMEYIDRAMQASFAETSTYIYPQGVPAKLQKYFGYKYDGAIHREECGGAEFENYIYNDLAQGMPVWTAGYSIPDRHGFVIDGYSYDDFFHINWGWEGLCNGYFRLGPLNAFNTSTKHSYGKHYYAIIGVRPDDGKTKLDYKSYAPVATASTDVKDLYFTTAEGENVTSERTAANAFTSSLTAELQNYTNSLGSSYVREFDVEMSLYDANMQLVGHLKPDVEKVSIAMSNTATVSYTLGSKLHEMNLANGEYKLVPRSRMYGQKNYFFDRAKGPYAYVKVVKSSNDIKLSLVPTYTVDSYEIIGQLKNTYKAGLRVHFTNNSFAKLANTLVLYKSSVANANTQDVQQLRVEPQSSGYVDLGFAVGSSTGTQTLLVVDKDMLKEIPSDIAQPTGINYGTTILTATFKGNTGTYATQDLECNWVAENTSGSYIYGNELHGYVEITNHGTEDYKDFFTLQTRTGSTSYNSKYKYVSSITALTIPAGKSARISLDELNYADIFDALKNGNSTNIGFSLYDGSYDEDNVKDERGLIGTKTWTYRSSAVLWWDKNGKMTATASLSTVTEGSYNNRKTYYVVPEDAVAISFMDKTPGNSYYVKPNSNPNTVYYFSSSSYAKRLTNYSSLNTIVGSTTGTKTASNAVIFNDAYGAYVPYGFTAKAGVSYTRTFDYGYEKNGNKGWTTICLPFTVESIKNGSTSIDWFHSASDKNKLFWVNQFYGEDFTKTLYTYTEAIMGNKPYLIAMPDESWGTKWGLTNKTITFSAGNNAMVLGGYNIVDGLPVVDADNQNFVSAAMAYRDMQNGKSVYSMENPGNDFVYVANPDLKSFRGYITKETSNSLVAPQTMSVISLGENEFEGGDETDGILQVENGKLTIDNDAVYDLQGRLVSTKGMGTLPKGLYIMNGKKIVK